MKFTCTFRKNYGDEIVIVNHVWSLGLTIGIDTDVRSVL